MTTTTTTTTTTTDLQQFYAEVLESSMLQEQLKAATVPDELCELAVELAKEKGYFFTKEEVLAAISVEAVLGEYDGLLIEACEAYNPNGTSTCP